MKRLVYLLTMIVMSVCIFSACGKDDKSDNTDKRGDANISVGCMKGPTAIGMIKLLSDSDMGKSLVHCNYKIAGTADEISTALIKKELDVAAVPCNLASVLYNKTEGEVVTVAINTLGVIYIVENGNEITQVSDLKGKTIYLTGQGTTPEYTLSYLLTSAGLKTDDVNLQFRLEASEVVAAFSKDKNAVALLPQPYVTVALNNNENYRIALDITKEWEKLNDSTVVTGVIVARKEFIENNYEKFCTFLAEYEESTQYANANVDETAKLLEQYDVFTAAIAKKAIPYCNVTYIDGDEMKRKAMAYLEVIYEQNANAVGGKLTEEMFYTEGK